MAPSPGTSTALLPDDHTGEIGSASELSRRTDSDEEPLLLLYRSSQSAASRQWHDIFPVIAGCIGEEPTELSKQADTEEQIQHKGGHASRPKIRL